MSHLKGGLTIIKEMVDTLPKSERKIAQFILEQPKEAVLLTAQALGSESQTSGAAVIRLCKSLGFSGFQELKLRVAGDLQEKSSPGFRDIEPNEDYNQIIEKVTANTMQSIKDTANMVNIPRLREAVETLIHADSITFIGFGASFITAKDAEQKFIRINKHVHAYSDLHIASTAIANKGPNDVVVGISFSGDTIEVTKLLDLAKKKNAKTISITKYGHTTLTSYADINLFTSSAKEAVMRSGATSSRIAQLHLIDILFMCVASEEYEKTVERLDATREAIEYFKGQMNLKSK
ncbi:MurR/RpiR family transcriptional regulator [Ornithinibacillus halotolerans]|uniref:HTH-type transcriptional regulator YbbH n=1 Tax=Ornithinibacillus halotolerans TaxID=1274357 RepID=A0A916RTL3_9BACI|nr:MurR/RpiR family transcriptional regulator [Ornithinibacillus halotolerans]GGA66709.1 putative HTH-type transcriptional regulator YbbH [Ornithinibacillus halotolerans]